MDTVQIYGIVNDVAKQSMGTEAVSAIDVTGLVAMGDMVFSSTDNTENFINTLVQRIGRSIVSNRAYKNQLGVMVKDDMQWGAILQKINVKMPEVEASEAFDLTDGESVDMYKVNTPKATQKLYASRTPYVVSVTIQRHTLKEAFLSETAMGAFIASVYTKVRNALELALENLGRLAMNNYIVNAGANQVIDLVSNYNTATDNTVTTAQAWFDADFLRYAIGQINLHARKMKSMSTLYNTDGEQRHSPLDKQNYAVLADFQTQLETVVQYAAFNSKYVEKVATLDIPYWQGAEEPATVSLKDGETTTTIENVVGFIFDTDALGTFRREEDVLTTPVNARARYTNTFWHEMQLWFNDMSENGVIFTLN